MPEKKKIAGMKKTKSTERRMTQPKAKKTEPEPAETPAASHPKGAAQTPPNGSTQLGSFEAGMKLFHARQFKEAREQFVDAAEGPERDVAQRSRLHMSMCDGRLQQTVVDLSSAEDYYNYGVALLNARNSAEAKIHLEKALEIAPDSDHIHYALALAQALSGDIVAAYANLNRAIELEPRNRILARQDADFAPLANQPPFQSLLYPERKTW